MSATPRRIVAVGAGHAHLHVAQHASDLARRGVELVLIDSGQFWYSGLATGMLGGRYSPADDQIDPQPLVEPGGRLIRGRATKVDLEERLVVLEGGSTVSFDRLSLNIGSEVDTSAIEGTEHAWPVKPIANLVYLRHECERRLRQQASLRVAVIGGGATGCEIAANLLALARQRSADMQVRVFSGSRRLLSQAPAGASRLMIRSLMRRGAACELGRRIVSIRADHVSDDGGRAWSADLTVLATGLQPPRWLRSLRLPIGEGGGLLVESTLRSAGDPEVFGTGDCIDFGPRSLPKLGVFGVRQAPVLLHNLTASLDNRPLRAYRPQRRWLSILNLGDGRALATWGPWYLHGRGCMAWKDWLDRRFMQRYRTNQRIPTPPCA